MFLGCLEEFDIQYQTRQSSSPYKIEYTNHSSEYQICSNSQTLALEVPKDAVGHGLSHAATNATNSINQCHQCLIWMLALQRRYFEILDRGEQNDLTSSPNPQGKMDVRIGHVIMIENIWYEDATQSINIDFDFFRYAHHHIFEKKILEPVPMSKSLRLGFLMAVKNILSIREDGLAAGGPPCGPWVWLNSATHRRRKEPADAIFGDTNKSYVKESNLFPGVLSRIFFNDTFNAFFFLVIPCTHHEPIPFMILFDPVVIFDRVARHGLLVWPGTAQACLPLGPSDASSHCPMCLHHNWAAWFELDAAIWLHQIREDLCGYSSGVWLVGRVFVRPLETNVKNRASVPCPPAISHLMLDPASVLPSHMGAHGHFSLKPSKCFGVALSPETDWQVWLDAAVIAVIDHIVGRLWTYAWIKL